MGTAPPKPTTHDTVSRQSNDSEQAGAISAISATSKQMSVSRVFITS